MRSILLEDVGICVLDAQVLELEYIELELELDVDDSGCVIDSEEELELEDDEPKGQEISSFSKEWLIEHARTGGALRKHYLMRTMN